MLVSKLLPRRKLTRVWCVLEKQARYSSQVAVESETIHRTSDLRLPENRPKKPTREPFAKNVFLGRFDVEFITFPEPQTHDRHRDFFEWLKPIEDYINEKVDIREIDLTSKVKDEIFQDLASLGVFKAAVDEAYGGLGLNNSEYAKLVETVSAVSVLGSYVSKHAQIVKLISKFGTEQQKSNLLPKIANGEITPTLCFSEVPTGSTSEALESTVTMSDCRTFFTLEARKTCVYNATNANLFLVIAKSVNPDPYITREATAAYLVPGNIKGITIQEPYQTLGQRGVDICDVNFDNVEIPINHRLGANTAELDLFVSAVGEGKQNIGAQSIGIMKRFLNTLTTKIRESKNFNKKRLQEDSAHEIIGNIAASLYAMEAMVYVTAGMMDNFENQDTTLEQALTECYCTEACKQMILHGMTALGASGYCKHQPFEQIVRDSLVLSCYDRSAIETKIFAAILGVQHAGVTLGTMIQKVRNPFLHPLEVMRTGWKLGGPPNLHIDENLHPSLRHSAKSLEYSVYNLKKCVEILLGRSGILAINQRMELGRLSDIMIDIYAMTSVVARASRAYCIGLRNADQEIRVAMIYTHETFEKIEKIIKDFTEGDMANGDLMRKEIANAIFDQKKYFAAHPLERNF